MQGAISQHTSAPRPVVYIKDIRTPYRDTSCKQRIFHVGCHITTHLTSQVCGVYRRHSDTLQGYVMYPDDISCRLPARPLCAVAVLCLFVLLCVRGRYTEVLFMRYGVATISRLLKIIGLFCRIASLLQGSFAKETYNFKEPTNRSHPIVAPGSSPRQQPRGTPHSQIFMVSEPYMCS